MKKLLSASSRSGTTDAALLIARLGIAVLMLLHGLPKLAMLFSDGPIQFPSVLGLGPAVALSLTVFAEVFCSLFILAGFATRLATLPLIVTMLVAIFSIHGADPFQARELAVMYGLAYVVLLFAGSGKYSVDYLLQRRLQDAVQPQLASRSGRRI